VDLDAKCSKDCILKLSSESTGRLDLQSGKSQSITMDSSLKSRTRLINEDGGAQALSVGEFTQGEREADYDLVLYALRARLVLEFGRANQTRLYSLHRIRRTWRRLSSWRFQ